MKPGDKFRSDCGDVYTVLQSFGIGLFTISTTRIIGAKSHKFECRELFEEKQLSELGLRPLPPRESDVV